MIKKAAKSGKDVFLALLNCRNAPNKIGSSPVERLYSRKTRGLLTITEKGLRPSIQVSVSKKILENKEQTKYQYDKDARNYGRLEVGKPVYVNLQRNPTSKNLWEKAEIVERFGDRSCLVNVNGHLYRRNLVDIRRAPENTENNPLIGL